MSGPGIVTLASLRTQSQERADQLNSSFLAISEWNRNIMGSYKELYDLLIAAYGSDYYATVPLVFPTDGTSLFYPLPNGSNSFTNGVTGLTVTPPAFYKLLGVDLILGGMPQLNRAGSAVTVKRFNFSDRNRYAVPNFQSFYGVSNLRIRLHDNNLWITPTASAGQFIQLWQVPRPADLQPEVICGLTAASTTITCTDTSNLAVGMYIQAPSTLALLNGIAIGTTISSITPNVSFVVSVAPTVTQANVLIRAWSESTTVDGVSGWEEYIIVDAAIKAMQKEESDVSILGAEKMAMIKRLQDMAENRDAANPATVSDTQSQDWFQNNGWGSGGGW